MGGQGGERNLHTKRNKNRVTLVIFEDMPLEKGMQIPFHGVYEQKAQGFHHISIQEPSITG